jgi:hypothetical protein
MMSSPSLITEYGKSGAGGIDIDTVTTSIGADPGEGGSGAAPGNDPKFDAIGPRVSAAGTVVSPTNRKRIRTRIFAKPKPNAAQPHDVDDTLLEREPRTPDPPKQNKRICIFPGCTNTVKSQGHCQKHGAIIKRCKAPKCTNQAQGGYKGYCKCHWRAFEAPEKVRKNAAKKSKKGGEEEQNMQHEPIGSSVYDHILPASFSWKADGSRRAKTGGAGEVGNTEFIPILQHFVDNESLDPGWHRLNERLARGLPPPKSLSLQLEPWENQLVLMEMALIAGTDTKHLTQSRTTTLMTHAWGREKGFMKKMVNKHCSRRGDVKRKLRSDAGSGHKSATNSMPESMIQESSVYQPAAADEIHELADSSGSFEVPLAI